MKICFFCIFSFLEILLVNSTSATSGFGNHLPLCPSSPNCISSQETDSHFAEPFPIAGEAKEAFSKLKEILEKRNDINLLPTTDDKMIRVEFRTTLLRYIDDGLFILDERNKVIHVRSAARIGYWDFGKNRRRMETIRQEYKNLMGIN